MVGHILPDALIASVSAAHNFNIGSLFDRILELLPEEPSTRKMR